MKNNKKYGEIQIVKSALAKLSTILFSILLLPVVTHAQQANSAILLIGDGLGPAHITAARIFKKNARDGELALDRFENVAFVRTYSEDLMVTDSAAAATALATGTKTRYGYLGLNGDGGTLDTILKRAKAAGKSVGIVTTARITHATPAASYANTTNRDDEDGIAEQLLDYGQIDLIMGGGREFFLPESVRDEERRRPGSRADGRNLVNEAEQAGFTVIHRTNEFAALRESIESGISPGGIIGLFNNSKMEYAYRNSYDRWGEPSLAEMTTFAIDVLSRNPNGFFLMVEGATIDHASHENWARVALEEVLAFDDAVNVAWSFTQSNSRTLVVATADHETGGLTINGYAPTEVGGEDLFMHLPQGGIGEVLSFSSGPGAARREGQEPTDRPTYRQPALHHTDSAAHTGVDVPAWATGPGAERIRGTMDNHEVGQALIAALLGED